MKCPTDGSVLVMSERSGVEIDYCPTCRGVWLDRGELDKLMRHNDREWDERDRWFESRDHSYKRPKKKRTLSEIFDFD